MTIETADKVKLEYRIANPLLRFLAFVIDYVILGAIFYLLLRLLELLSLVNDLGEMFDPEHINAAQSAFIYIIIFMLRWGYYLFFEMIFEGRTPGKMICRLRTIHYQGRALDLPALVLRNFARALDQDITFFLGGCIAMLCNREYRRLGDLLGNTIVVQDERPLALDEKPALVVDPARLPPEAVRAVFVRLLSEEDLYVLRRFLSDQARIPQIRRRELQSSLAACIRGKIQDSFEPKEPLVYLQSVYFRHQTGSRTAERPAEQAAHAG